MGVGVNNPVYIQRFELLQGIQEEFSMQMLSRLLNIIFNSNVFLFVYNSHVRPALFR